MDIRDLYQSLTQDSGQLGCWEPGSQALKNKDGSMLLLLSHPQWLSLQLRMWNWNLNSGLLP